MMSHLGPEARKWLRFGFSGMLNAAFGYAVFFLFLKAFGWDYKISILLSTLLGVLFNFLTSSKIVFRNFKWGFLPRFILVYTVAYLANIGLMSLLERKIGMAHEVSAALLLVPMAVLTFLLQKVFVFERKPPPPPPGN